METTKEILKRISHRINKKSEDTFLNHLKTYFQIDQTKYWGNCTESEFKIWKYSPYSGLFHVVIRGQITDSENGKRIVLTAHLNKLALAIAITIILILFLSFIDISKPMEITLGKLFLGLIFVSLFGIAMILAFLSERKKAMNNIKELIEQAG